MLHIYAPLGLTKRARVVLICTVDKYSYFIFFLRYQSAVSNIMYKDFWAHLPTTVSEQDVYSTALASVSCIWKGASGTASVVRATLSRGQSWNAQAPRTQHLVQIKYHKSIIILRIVYALLLSQLSPSGL